MINKLVSVPKEDQMRDDPLTFPKRVQRTRWEVGASSRVIDPRESCGQYTAREDFEKRHAGARRDANATWNGCVGGRCSAASAEQRGWVDTDESARSRRRRWGRDWPGATQIPFRATTLSLLALALRKVNVRTAGYLTRKVSQPVNFCL